MVAVLVLVLLQIVQGHIVGGRLLPDDEEGRWRMHLG